MNYYVDTAGNYLGGWDANPPTGAIEVPEPPQDARQVWVGQAWRGIPVTPETIAARRWQAEVAGITVNGMQVDTGRDSQALITGATVQAMLDPSYALRWKTAAGFVDLNAEQIIGLASTVRSHVQACFDREAELLEAVGNGTFTDAMLEEGWPQ